VAILTITIERVKFTFFLVGGRSLPPTFTKIMTPTIFLLKMEPLGTGSSLKIMRDSLITFSPLPSLTVGDKHTHGKLSSISLIKASPSLLAISHVETKTKQKVRIRVIEKRPEARQGSNIL
jgi:hypothetical protein